MKPKFLLLSAAVAAILSSGCASVPMDTPEHDAAAKRFDPPPAGYSGLYIYRNAMLGTAVKKTVWVDGQYLGPLGYDTFFYRLVKPGPHTIATQSEWGVNETDFEAEEGRNFFFQQKFLFGLFQARAQLYEVPEGKGMKHAAKLKLALGKEDGEKNLPDAEQGEGKGSVSPWGVSGTPRAAPEGN